jgi:hypothetical protein
MSLQQKKKLRKKKKKKKVELDLRVHPRTHTLDIFLGRIGLPGTFGLFHKRVAGGHLPTNFHFCGVRERCLEQFWFVVQWRFVQKYQTEEGGELFNCSNQRKEEEEQKKDKKIRKTKKKKRASSPQCRTIHRSPCEPCNTCHKFVSV